MARRQAFKITGQVPALAGLPLRIKRASLPTIVKVASVHVRDVAPKRRGLSSPKSIASRIKGVVDVPGEWGSVRATAPHAHLLELGVKAHSLKPGARTSGRRRPSKAWLSKHQVMTINGSPDILRRGAWHPGFSARPFMQQGLDAAEDDIEGVLQRQALVAFGSDLKRVEDLIGSIS